MPTLSFDRFFKQATDKAPYEYQCRLACGERGGRPDSGWLASGSPCESRLINIPTGLGKTAAVVLAWLWNRAQLRNPEWPRRLVYCLPMRTLVEQTEAEAKKWLDTHDLYWGGGLADRKGKVGVHILMGGEDAGKWDIYPEENAIVIGTQDMLLSRALNRGYGMSRYRWPVQFGLLNNDCLWVMDEAHLMGPGLSTSCQLEAFRGTGASGFASIGGNGSVTWYMSATNNPDHLKTREWRTEERPGSFEFGLAPEEKSATSGEVSKRRLARKRLEQKQHLSSSSPGLVEDVLKLHAEMLSALTGTSEPHSQLHSRTLIICNTVDRAVAVYEQLRNKASEGCDLLLLHSRFRPPERRAQMERLKSDSLTTFPGGQIVVATQVIEAGVNISSGILWSEVAPLSSLVQRLGRLNRSGEFNQNSWEPLAVIFGVGTQTGPQRESKEAAEKRQKVNAKCCLPYELTACEAAWNVLAKLEGDASPANLERIQTEIAASIPRCPYSLQRHELLDFFDTDANLSLGFTDVSPFVRGLDDDTDLNVLWRENWLQKDGTEGNGEPGFAPDFQRDELCPVPISKASAREVLNHGWIYRGKDAGWMSVRDSGVIPGMTVLLPLKAGGYDQAIGWTGKAAHNKHPSHFQQSELPSDEDQLSSLANGWQSIAVHTKAVENELRDELSHLLKAPEHESEHDALLNAVTWHDVGKNHPGWQNAVLTALEKAGITSQDMHKPFAKFSLSDSSGLAGLEGEPRRERIRKLRSSFRPAIAHEVASALAFRASEQSRLGSNRDTDIASLLAEYLIMSHHGRVRKVLRDEIPKLPDTKRDILTVRGVADGDCLPAVQIGGQSLGCASLSTDCRKMGRGLDGHESYTRGVLRILEKYGPFRLAYFEALFRAADNRASKQASQAPKA